MFENITILSLNTNRISHWGLGTHKVGLILKPHYVDKDYLETFVEYTMKNRKWDKAIY